MGVRRFGFRLSPLASHTRVTRFEFATTYPCVRRPYVSAEMSLVSKEMQKYDSNASISSSNTQHGTEHSSFFFLAALLHRVRERRDCELLRQTLPHTHCRHTHRSFRLSMLT